MRSNEHANLLDIIGVLDPVAVIPALEKGIELQKLDLIINPDCELTKRSIRQSRAFLSLLYGRRLGL